MHSQWSQEICPGHQHRHPFEPGEVPAVERAGHLQPYAPHPGPIVGIDAVDIFLCVPRHGLQHQVALRDLKARGVQDGQYLLGDARAGELVEGFQGPHDFRHDQAIRDQDELARRCTAEHLLDGLRLRGHIVRQVTQKEVRVGKEAVRLHAR